MVAANRSSRPPLATERAAQQRREQRGLRVQRGERLADSSARGRQALPGRRRSSVDRGPQQLDRIVQRCLLADHDSAEDEPCPAATAARCSRMWLLPGRLPVHGTHRARRLARQAVGSVADRLKRPSQSRPVGRIRQPTMVITPPPSRQDVRHTLVARGPASSLRSCRPVVAASGRRGRRTRSFTKETMVSTEAGQLQPSTGPVSLHPDTSAGGVARALGRAGEGLSPWVQPGRTRDPACAGGRAGGGRSAGDLGDVAVAVRPEVLGLLVPHQATLALLIVSARRTTLRRTGSVRWLFRQIR